jgi:hypothetical protein
MIKSLFPGLAKAPTISHLQGHQDDKVKYCNLLLPVQLNCDADALAFRELEEYPKTCKIFPLLPAAKVRMYIGRCTVTRNLPAHYMSTTWLATAEIVPATTFLMAQLYY